MSSTIRMVAGAAALVIAAGTAVASVQQSDVTPTGNGVLTDAVSAEARTDRTSGNASLFITFNIDIDSVDAFGDPDNLFAVLDVNATFGTPAGSPVIIHGVSWDVQISTFSPSWLSEAAVAFDDNDNLGDPDSFFLSPGVGDDFPGTSTYTDAADLTDVGFNDLVLDNGNLYIEFFEQLDDFPGLTDAVWTAGTDRLVLDVTVVPAPGAAAIFGLAGLIMTRRRR